MTENDIRELLKDYSLKYKKFLSLKSDYNILLINKNTLTSTWHGSWTHVKSSSKESVQEKWLIKCERAKEKCLQALNECIEIENYINGLLKKASIETQSYVIERFFLNRSIEQVAKDNKKSYDGIKNIYGKIYKELAKISEQ